MNYQEKVQAMAAELAENFVRANSMLPAALENFVRSETAMRADLAKAIRASSKLPADLAKAIRASSKLPADLDRDVSNVLRDVSNVFSVKAKLESDIKFTRHQISSVLSAMNGGRTPIRRAEQNTNRNEDVESRAISIQVEGVDFVLRVSCSIRIRNEDVDFER